jgi:hypothetical protein
MAFATQIISLSILFLFEIGLASFPVSAATYYVDTNKGNDSNAGISRQAPLKTIQMGADKTVPGDTVIVLPGSYGERVRVTRSGASGQPIVFQAEDPAVCHGFTIRADHIHIIGFEITDTVNDWAEGAGIHLQGKYGEIRSNSIHDVTRVGIQVWAADKDSPETSDCKIVGNRIVRAGLSGIEIYGRNHLVEGNDISHTLQRPPKWVNPPDWVDADGMRFFGSGHVIRRNHIHDISTADPGNTDPHVDCFQTWGPAYNILIEQNDCDIPDDGMQAIMINALTPPVRDITVRNNVVKAFQFLNVWNADCLVVVNNTFVSRLSYQRGSAYAIELHDSPNAKIRNNIFYDAGRNEYAYLWNDNGSAAGLEVGHNCHYISNGFPPAGLPWPDDLWTNPKLLNPSANNFRLLKDSPLIDRGNFLAGVSNDFDGNVRPLGQGFDIGAFEFQPNTSTMTPPNGLRVLR